VDRRARARKTALTIAGVNLLRPGHSGRRSRRVRARAFGPGPAAGPWPTIEQEGFGAAAGSLQRIEQRQSPEFDGGRAAIRAGGIERGGNRPPFSSPTRSPAALSASTFLGGFSAGAHQHQHPPRHRRHRRNEQVIGAAGEGQQRRAIPLERSRGRRRGRGLAALAGLEGTRVLGPGAAITGRGMSRPAAVAANQLSWAPGCQLRRHRSAPPAWISWEVRKPSDRSQELGAGAQAGGGGRSRRSRPPPCTERRADRAHRCRGGITSAVVNRRSMRPAPPRPA